MSELFWQSQIDPNIDISISVGGKVKLEKIKEEEP